MQFENYPRTGLSRRACERAYFWPGPMQEKDGIHTQISDSLPGPRNQENVMCLCICLCQGPSSTAPAEEVRRTKQRKF
jgi:hypothetical protein